MEKQNKVVGKSAVKKQTQSNNGKVSGVKYRVDFDSWEEYNKYKGKKA